MNYLESLVTICAVKEATAPVISELSRSPFYFGWDQGMDCQGWISNLPLKLLPMENVISGIRVKICFLPQVRALLIFHFDLWQDWTCLE